MWRVVYNVRGNEGRRQAVPTDNTVPHSLLSHSVGLRITTNFAFDFTLSRRQFVRGLAVI